MNTTQSLPEQTDDKRLEIFRLITSACTHLYSKGSLVRERFNAVAPTFASLAKQDPIFLAHLTSWAATKESKDLKTLSVFFCGLNDADGTPYFKGATANKPNFRAVAAAVIQTMDPHSALRVLELSHLKFSVPGLLNEGRHFPTQIQTSFKKYLRHRENNPAILQGIVKAGLRNKLKRIYRLTHTCPSDTGVAILGWKQKDNRKIDLQKLPDFANMSSAEIAEELVKSKLKPQVALSVIPQNKITVKVAEALLSNATGNQALILQNFFRENGFLEVAGIAALFKEKVKTATTAIDRIDTLSKNASAEEKKELVEIRSQKRKETARLSEIGKVFMHIDVSGSMTAAVEFAKERASIIAECVDNPEKNFGWGTFDTSGRVLPIPSEFTKTGFHQALYGVRAGGGTDCLALYEKARRFGADVDVFVTDSQHGMGNRNGEVNIVSRIEKFHQDNPGIPKPKCAVIVKFGEGILGTALKQAGIPVAYMTPQALSESALVAESVRNACKGELAIIEEIMSTPLPTLPKWYHTVGK